MKRLTKKQRTVAETLCQLIENEGIAKEVIKDGFVVIDDFHFYLTRAMVMAGYSNRTIEKYAFDHEMPEQLYTMIESYTIDLLCNHIYLDNIHKKF